MYSVWFAALLAVYSFSSADALTCYNCVACEEPFDPSSTVKTPCGGGDQVCVKLNVKTRDGSLVTGRQCAPRIQSGQDICSFLKKSGASLGSVVGCGVCTSNLCNK